MGDKKTAHRLLVGDHLDDQDVGGWITFKMDILEIGWGAVDWIGLAEVRAKWRALVNMEMNRCVP
jgi:hypothetical protein